MVSKDRFKQFENLFHHRWSLPLIAEIDRLSGAKFVTLANRLRLSRDSLSHTLEALIASGFLMRNTGYGHPLRPEYVLTPSGRAIGDVCQRLMKLLTSMKVERIALKKWSLPVIYRMGAGCVRFTELRTCLPGITPRALTQTLKTLEDNGLVRSENIMNSSWKRYVLSPQGRKLCPLLSQLVKTISTLN